MSIKRLDTLGDKNEERKSIVRRIMKNHEITQQRVRHSYNLGDKELSRLKHSRSTLIRFTTRTQGMLNTDIEEKVNHTIALEPKLQTKIRADRR